MALLIIACSSAKTTRGNAALQLYTGRQFTRIFEAFMDWGWQAGHQVVILSAEHGLVDATRTLAGYDTKMTPSRALELATDPNQEAKATELAEEYGDVYVYGGRLYREIVKTLFGEAEEIVGLDRGCGDHFSALTELLQGAL